MSNLMLIDHNAIPRHNNIVISCDQQILESFEDAYKSLNRPKLCFVIIGIGIRAHM